MSIASREFPWNYEANDLGQPTSTVPESEGDYHEIIHGPSVTIAFPPELNMYDPTQPFDGSGA